MSLDPAIDRRTRQKQEKERGPGIAVVKDIDIQQRPYWGSTGYGICRLNMNRTQDIWRKKLMEYYFRMTLPIDTCYPVEYCNKTDQRTMRPSIFPLIGSNLFPMNLNVCSLLG